MSPDDIINNKLNEVIHTTEWCLKLSSELKRCRNSTLYLKTEDSSLNEISAEITNEAKSKAIKELTAKLFSQVDKLAELKSELCKLVIPFTKP